jgi:hypothetical protein
VLQDARQIVTVAKVLALTLAISLISSCSRDNRQADIKQCMAEAEKDAAAGITPDLSPADAGEVRHDKLGAAVAACMSKEGYGHANFDMSDQRCVDDVDFNPYCYQRH